VLSSRQAPRQLACAMQVISTLKVHSFVEVGSYSGWTGAYLAALIHHIGGDTPANTASLDVGDYRQPCCGEVMKSIGHRFELISQDRQASIHQSGMPPMVDLCFIDGNHQYSAVHLDVEAWKSRCRVWPLHLVHSCLWRTR
jgi:predicted O-methyltransferase YrrM